MPTARPIIHLFAPGPLGGAEKVVITGLTALLDIQAPIELWLITESRAPQLSAQLMALLPKNLKLRQFIAQGPLDIKLWQQLKKELAVVNPKIIHTHGFKVAIYAYLAAKKSLPHVHTHHGRTAHTAKVRFYEWLETQVMKRAQQVHAVSGPMAQELKAQGLKQVRLVENPLSFFPTQAPGTPVGPCRLLFVGRLSPEKGGDILLSSLASLLDLSWELTMVGEGVMGESWREMAKHFPAGRIHWVGFQTHVASFMAQAQILVMPSRREGLPMALIEGICQGLPVVGSRVGGLIDLVYEGKNGLLVNPDDPQALTQALREVISGHTEFSAKAQQLALGFQQRFSPRNWAQKTMMLYQEL